MNTSQLKQIIREEIEEASNASYRGKRVAKIQNLVIKSDGGGVSIKRLDPNDGGRVNSDIYISKSELPGIIDFLNSI
jgi:sporulation protein YlmC with PRC-barrel domain